MTNTKPNKRVTAPKPKPKPEPETVIVFDPNTMTFGDALALEQAGVDVGEAFDGKHPALSMMAVAFLAKRKQDPSFTWVDAQDLEITFLEDLVG